MKQTKRLLLSLLVIAMLFACGCTYSKRSKDDVINTSKSGTQAPEIKETSAPPAESAPVEKLTCTYEIPDESFISIDFATDALLEQYKAYEEFNETEDLENQVRVILKISPEAKDFRFFEIFFDKDGEKDNTNFIVNRVLYSKDKISPEKPLVVGTVFQGSLPIRAISFVDESNKTRYFSFETNGMDGSLFLLELVPRDNT